MSNEPQFIENKEFVALEEEDIQKLNRIEARKFEENPEIPKIALMIEEELEHQGYWEEHWITVDDSGKRVYSRIYYTDEKALALTADGQIIREINFPMKRERDLH